jgi:hypothetical protein
VRSYAEGIVAQAGKEYKVRKRVKNIKCTSTKAMQMGKMGKF